MKSIFPGRILPSLFKCILQKEWAYIITRLILTWDLETCNLASAFYEMTSQTSGRHFVEVVEAPLELMDAGGQGKRAVSCSASHHDVGAHLKGLDDGTWEVVGLRLVLFTIQLCQKEPIMQWPGEWWSSVLSAEHEYLLQTSMILCYKSMPALSFKATSLFGGANLGPLGYSLSG